MTLKPEHPDIECSQEHAPDAAAVASGWKLQSLEESDSTVTVDVTEVKTDLPHQQQSAFGRLTAFIPDKWINVKLYSPEGAGSFKVGRVNEADFEACTGGGSLEVGSIKAGKAVIKTEGGSLKGRELSASEVRVETREGAVELQRFVALHGAIKSASAVNVTVVYGETVSVESGGSTISIGNLDCSTSASLLSHGGHITVNGLDGRN
ncbi:hypothetical protein CEUSTIGMA_g8541.t1 [Chlamydomonas eustigma]|uniref:DUF4097 domain-containing protein n=1 Tax=Chlamydomonas eustigma TaxID=1157962 RepID=A0A250XDE1_9CHLO|nr:hypothetical protein CEUSTIGMA_g8541.t1 [Chlamydomonas eustigma]|eukprot:GAX81107.1 hypothetical protein CEUSTIGMA_g8541.t1 [Chlamydomonas eustigma]